MKKTTGRNREKSKAELTQQTGGDKTAIRPFHVNVPEAELTELRRRINATSWPERETVTDQSQGVQLATIQKLAHYWATDYDWRKLEAKLNAVPNFITEIDGLDIHFIHVRSKHDDALPLIVTHGWPGSLIEQLKIVDPLTNPTAHGASASDAFHLVIPSIPGFGFSGKPTTTGWGPDRIARAWTELMKRLGYTRFVAQGGDWGALITDLMGLQAPPELVGIHTNMPGAIPPDIDKLLQCDITGVNNALGSLPSNLSDDSFFAAKGVSIPVAVSAFPDELYQAPRSWAEQAYPNLIHYNKLDKGGHFAAWEQPQLLSEEVRAGFRPLRNRLQTAA